MPEAAFFTRFGLFADPDFLDAATCGRVVAEMRQRGGRPATVSLAGEHVDEDYRRTTLVDISDETRVLVEDRIRGARPAIARHFDEQLDDMERAGFLPTGRAITSAATQTATATDRSGRRSLAAYRPCCS